MFRNMLPVAASIYRDTYQIYSGAPGQSTSLDFSSTDNFYCDVSVEGVTTSTAVTLFGVSDSANVSEDFSFSEDGALRGSTKFDSLDYLNISPAGSTVTIRAYDSVGSPRTWRGLVGTYPVRLMERRTVFEVIEPGGRVSGRYRLYCESHVDIQNQDVVVVGDATFRVDSEPETIYSLFGAHHKEMTVVVEET